MRRIFLALVISGDAAASAGGDSAGSDPRVPHEAVTRMVEIDPDPDESAYAFARMHHFNLEWCLETMESEPRLAAADLDPSSFEPLEDRLNDLAQDWDPDRVAALDDYARLLLDHYHEDLLRNPDIDFKAMMATPEAFAAFCGASATVGTAYT